jgi:hypothetical protein
LRSERLLLIFWEVRGYCSYFEKWEVTVHLLRSERLLFIFWEVRGYCSSFEKWEVTVHLLRSERLLFIFWEVRGYCSFFHINSIVFALAKHYFHKFTILSNNFFCELLFSQNGLDEDFYTNSFLKFSFFSGIEIWCQSSFPKLNCEFKDPDKF